MQNNTEEEKWNEYCKQELVRLAPILKNLGYSLDEQQPHISGERYLTRPLGSGRKLLLLGHQTADNIRVVIKTSSEVLGIKEIEHEHVCREILEKISFAYQTFLSPKELLYTQADGMVLLITAFIEQSHSFLERPLEEQFELALKSFKAQESAHATTYGHIRLIQKTFGEMHAAQYIEKFKKYVDESQPYADLSSAYEFLKQNIRTIEQYCGFLTHWDFMPQNIRIVGEHIYLLDHSSIHFGNKYEGWARFINFMTLYNPPLARALLQYVRNNRTPEESLSLKLMRVYRLGELIRYYTGWLPRTEGKLHELATARIYFWNQVLEAVLNDTEVSMETVETYKHTRDSLRSDAEKQRQVGLH